MALRFRVSKADWEALIEKGEVLINVPRTKYWGELICHCLEIEDEDGFSIIDPSCFHVLPIGSDIYSDMKPAEMEILRDCQGLSTPDIVIADVHFNGEAALKPYNGKTTRSCYQIRVVKKCLITGKEQDEAKAKEMQGKGKRRK